MGKTGANTTLPSEQERFDEEFDLTKFYPARLSNGHLLTVRFVDGLGQTSIVAVRFGRR
jgi:hypothetical protein